MLTEAFLVFSCVHTADNTVKCLSLKDKVKTHPYASNSVLLSLAAHVTFFFPFLDITSNSAKTPKIVPQKQEVNDHLTNHPLQEFWCDQFFYAIVKNQAIRKQNTLYIVLEITNAQYEQVLKQKQKMNQFQMKFQQNWVDQILKSVSCCEQLSRKSQKIAFLNVSGSQLRKDFYMPIINVRAIVLGQIFNNQNWKCYDVLKGEVPTFQQFLQLDAVMIPGSTNSVLSDIREIEEMSKNLFNAFQTNKKLKIFGICYGHQLIACKNKGQVVKKKRTDKVERYEFEEDKIKKLKAQFSFLNNLADTLTNTLLLEHHQDYVQKVSDEFHVLASSESSKVECMLHKSGRMLSFQSHPEYFWQYSQGYMQRLMKYKNGITHKGHIHKQGQELMRTHHDSSIRMRKVISEFLNWNCQVKQEQRF